MNRNIVIYPNEILRRQSAEAAVSDMRAGKYDGLVVDMIGLMNQKDGLGIAAPQVGESVRIIVINDEHGPLVLFNPEIERLSWRKKGDEEGCLSLPGVFGLVKRSVKVTVRAQNRNGEEIKFKAMNLFARVIQHEVDHLNGILFIDKAQKIGTQKAEFKKVK
jgi:peptide deformylase